MIKTSKDIVIRTADNGKDYIGIKIASHSNEDSEVVVPKYYMPEMRKKVSDLSGDEKDKLKRLVRAWGKYQSRVKSSNNGHIPQEEGMNYDFDSAFELVRDFLQYGLFIEFERAEIRSNTGKIDFPKTIKRCVPIVLNEGPLYLPYFTRIKKIADENLVRAAQIMVLNDISEKIGWLIGFNVQFPQEPLHSSSFKVIIQKLTDAKSTSYNSRKLNLITQIINYLTMGAVSLSDAPNKMFLSTANKFWEDMVSMVLGNVDHNTLNKDFYIRHRYISPTGMIYKRARELNPLMPDAVYMNKNSVTILDAKFYTNGAVPENDDITKQFAYMRKAFGLYGSQREYRNVFVMPTENKWHYSNKSAVFDIDIASTGDLQPIEILYLNMSEVVEYYLESKNISGMVL